MQQNKDPCAWGCRTATIMMLPPPCLAVGTVLLGLKASPFFLATNMSNIHFATNMSNIHGPKQFQFSIIKPKHRAALMYCSLSKRVFWDDGPEAHHNGEHSQLCSLKHQVQKRPGQQQLFWYIVVMSRVSCWHLWLFSSLKLATSWFVSYRICLLDLTVMQRTAAKSY